MKTEPELRDQHNVDEEPKAHEAILEQRTQRRIAPLLLVGFIAWLAYVGGWSLLVFVFARKRHPENGQPLHTGAFDTGAAWFSLALQAERLGLVTRAMGGIHHDRVYESFGVPEAEFQSMVAIAVGYPAPREELPSDLAEREVPSQRKPQHEFVFAGRYQR